jgi:hypothetical protein
MKNVMEGQLNVMSKNYLLLLESTTGSHLQFGTLIPKPMTVVGRKLLRDGNKSIILGRFLIHLCEAIRIRSFFKFEAILNDINENLISHVTHYSEAAKRYIDTGI